MGRLCHLLKLESIELSGAPVGDAAAETMRNWKALRSLGMDNTLIGDEFLKGVAHIGAITQISLQNTMVSDAGLAHLGGMIRMTFLDGSRYPCPRCWAGPPR